MRKCFLIIASYLSFIQVCFSVSFMDITDTEKDPQIKRHYLARYITQVHLSRVDYLKARIKNLDSDRSDLSVLGTTGQGVLVVEGKKNGAGAYQQTYLDIYQRDLAFWETDPFTVPLGLGNMNLDPSRDGELALLFRVFAGTLRDAYQKARVNRVAVRSRASSDQLAMEPILLEGDYMLEDLARIVRAIRPHLSRQSSLDSVKQGHDDLKTLGLLDACYQWQDLTLDPRVSSELKKHFNPDGTLKPLELEEDKTVKQMAELKGSLVSTPILGEDVSVSAVREPFPVLDTSRQESKKEEFPSAITSPTSLDKEKKVVKERPQVRGEKVKTRPSPAQQELNKLFDATPAWKKAKQKLDAEGSSSRARETEEPIPSVTLKESKLKILRKILDRNCGEVNVEKALNLLSDLGFLESTSDQHLELKIKPTAFWLNGTRTLIDAAPIETLAVAHKSGKKKYFKPWALQKLRSALLDAGFGKLLD